MKENVRIVNEIKKKNEGRLQLLDPPRFKAYSEKTSRDHCLVCLQRFCRLDCINNISEFEFVVAENREEYKERDMVGWSVEIWYDTITTTVDPVRIARFALR